MFLWFEPCIETRVVPGKTWKNQQKVFLPIFTNKSRLKGGERVHKFMVVPFHPPKPKWLSTNKNTSKQWFLSGVHCQLLLIWVLRPTSRNNMTACIFVGSNPFLLHNSIIQPQTKKKLNTHSVDSAIDLINISKRQYIILSQSWSKTYLPSGSLGDVVFFSIRKGPKEDITS